jgi:hypothetical protein
MSASLLFWLLMLLWLVAFVFGNWPFKQDSIKTSAGNIVMFVLLLILGWRTFGPPIHG